MSTNKGKTDKERVDMLTNVQKKILSGLYDDLFGAERTAKTKKEKSPASDVKLPYTDIHDLKNLSEIERDFGVSFSKDGTPSASMTVTPGRPAPSTGISSDEALRSARDALLEARRLIEEDELNTGNPPTPPAEGGTAVADAAPEQQEKQEPEEDPMEQLDRLVGLTTIKRDVKEMADFARMSMMRKEQGLKSVPVSMHLVFTGNPGTGKTTVARILSKIYKQIGVLSKGQLVEVDRSGLVAGFVGQTALKTQEVIKSALGGVLFIDEAYALSQKDDNFGQEAIDTILKAMEDHRDDFIVIVAGYTKPMEKFINSNPGLKSRFNKYIEFPDYSVDELEKIFYMNCDKYDYKVADDAKDAIRAMILSRKVSNPVNFANAREVRNMFEEIITNQARRVVQMENPTAEDITMILIDDLTEDDSDWADAEKKDAEKKEAEKKEAGKKEAEENAAEEKEAEEKADEGKTTEEKVNEEKAAEEKADGEKAAEEKAGE